MTADHSSAPLLDQIEGPADLKDLDDDQLQQVAQEVRQLVIDTIGEIGGHFGANLGACEIAVALHSLLESPRDKILWDVGHQAYPHKVLTGRREQLHTIRKYEGLAPFCAINESEHDIMGAGHASTSVSYAVGIKEAMRQGAGPDGKVVAVIGDGALTGGVSFEALLNAGGLDVPIVIVVNDNGMSIAPNVGALSRYFNRMRLNPKLYHAREDAEEALTRLPAGIGKRIERLGPILKESLKAYWAPGLFFEELDLAYVGVIDGHDVKELREAIGEALEAERPVVVHCKTVKGKGFAPAEEGGLEGMEQWHAAKPGSIVNGAAAPKKGGTPAKKKAPSTSPPQYTTVFGQALVEECRRDSRVVGITAAMNSGTGLNILQKELPERYYDVGIAEQHAVLFAAGLALEGAKPVAAIYSTFLQRGYDQIVHDVCLQQLNVVFAHGSRRTGRRRRADPPRRLRHLLPALPSAHHPDGAPGRGRAGSHAPHRARPRRRARWRCATRGGRPRGCRCRLARSRSSWAAGSCCAREAAGWPFWATATACPWRWARPSCWPASTEWRPPWRTHALPSRSTASWWRRSRPSTRCW